MEHLDRQHVARVESEVLQERATAESGLTFFRFFQNPILVTLSDGFLSPSVVRPLKEASPC